MGESDIIRSIMHADEEIYPTFESAEEELKYLQTEYDLAAKEASDQFELSRTDPSLFTRAQNANEKANYWIEKLMSFKNSHPELLDQEPLKE